MLSRVASQLKTSGNSVCSTVHLMLNLDYLDDSFVIHLTFRSIYSNIKSTSCKTHSFLTLLRKGLILGMNIQISISSLGYPFLNKSDMDSLGFISNEQ